MKYALYKFILLTIFLSSATICAFGQTERERGVELYKQGKNKEALAVLERVSKQKESGADAAVWNYLGLAYLDDGEVKKGRKALQRAAKISPQDSNVRTNLAYAHLLGGKLNNAHEEVNKAISLDSQNFAAYYIRGSTFLQQRKFQDALADTDKVIKINPNYSLAYILKSDALIGQFGDRVAGGSTVKSEAEFLKQSANVLENCLKNCQNDSNRKILQEKLETIRVFYDHFSREITDIINQTPTAEPNTTPLKILAKPRASYTDKARSALISGTIRLAVLFAADGRISQIIVLSALGFGLDKEAVEAARQIKFTPQIKDGKPVSVVKQIEYSFTIY